MLSFLKLSTERSRSKMDHIYNIPIARYQTLSFPKALNSHLKSSWSGHNFILSNEKKSDLPLRSFDANKFSEVRIQPVGAVVKKVIMRGDSEFGGV